MTTDKTQELDEILADKTGAVSDNQKQAILDWHNKQVEAVLDRLEKSNTAESCVPDCDEVQHARHEGSWGLMQRMDTAIENEREKLNNPDGDVK